MTRPPESSRHVPKKNFGQHFLINTGLQQRIVEACGLTPEDVVLEIGPGKGAITKLIAPRVRKLIAVEKDQSLAAVLARDFADTPHVEIIAGDILDFAITRAGAPVKIVGNLPYNISTPIMEKVIRERESCRGFYFMVQKEYAERLIAAPGGKEYGSLSCFAQYHAQIRLLFRISRGSFRPMPKVESAFCACHFYQNLPYQAMDERALFTLIQTAFQQRRKKIENALATLIPAAAWEKLQAATGIDPRLRPEQVSLARYVALANELEKIT